MIIKYFIFFIFRVVENFIFINIYFFNIFSSKFSLHSYKTIVFYDNKKKNRYLNFRKLREIYINYKSQ